ncbi:sodium/proline symporter PutP [Ruminococcus sp. AF17-11]|nr:sodium/proline symporter PutP [Ruminococcus sp. AF17-11]RGG88288.1 sodium/proline symporter PutP [Ruminococcus sp. AF17-11]
MTTNNIIVLCAFIAYMIIMIVIGFVCSKGNKNNEDYFLGGRNLGSWTAAMSAQASDMSGWLLMGLPGAVYLAGTGEAWIAVGLLIGTILNWYIVSARLRKYTIVAGNSLTIPSFFKNRYRDHKNIIKIVSASIIAVFFTVYTASAFSSGAKLFATLFSDSASGDENYNRVYVIGLIVAAVVILVYTFMGGFKAVCTTDLIQGLMMIVAILTVPVLAYAILTFDTSFSSALAAKGVEQPAQFLNFFVNGDGTPVSAVSIISNLAWGLGYFGMPHILVRFMAVKSNEEIKKSRKIAVIWVIISLTASCLIGLIARGYLTAQLDDATSESVFIRTIQQLFSGNGVLIFIGGIFLCGILAAIMSTADSQLLVTASAVSEDLYKGAVKKNASEKSSLLVGKIAVAVVAVIAFFIALNPKSSIMGLVSDAWAGFGSAFGPVVLLALFWKRSTLSGAISGMATGALTVIIWDYIPLVNGQTLYAATSLYSLVVGFGLALIVNVIVSLLSKKPSKEIMDEFDSIKNIEV